MIWIKKRVGVYKKMTPRQNEIYLVIEEWWNRFGFGPTVDDIMRVTGDRSRANVHRMMKRLCEAGACKRVPGRARSIRPIHIKFRNLQ
jgi:SOS-response transcriptional repressor LexA